ncbi:PTS trehalose transporter subunit IIBC [Marinilactibacillus psychrotolerans]|uniref:PTS trehalose transporter subunit IIBC n=1 Tax=Marinilactibacillus psychrotolerans TaxID=191770 RepID=A0A5R9C3H9_9LACT|nr:PTS system trehalose-specific EIIBC component [Marinilactibacillus psychrotolerans]TLQ07284.1 PTS trehalose transporter subunit IIBC [Marinilactibacillus psychrotolerans]
MADFKKDAKELLDAIGGKENVNAVTHCATRMRFVLDDPSDADVKRIEDIPSVKGTFTQAGQFQVIIGNRVADFYNEFSDVSGLEGVSKDDVKSAGAKHMNWLQRLMAALAEIFTPLIPAIIIGGLILGFRNVLEGIQFESLGQLVVDGQLQFTNAGAPIYNSIVNVSQFWAGVNDFLWLPGEAIFHFLPVGITWSVTRKMGTTQILGIVLGITLVSPQLLNAYGVQEILAGDVQTWDFGFFQLDKIGYQAQVIPAMMAGFLLAYLEKWLRKVIPEAISMIFVPLFALVPTIFIAHAVIGPIGWTLGTGLSQVVNWGLSGTFNWLFGFVFGGLYAPLVITGLHHMSNAIDLQLVADYGGTNLWPMIALSNIAQGSAVLGMIIMHWGDKKEEQVSIPAAISAYLGVTEPALFGINIKFVYPFVAGMIGSAFAGMISVALGVTANSIGVGGLPGFLSIQTDSMIGFFIAMAVAFFVPIILTIFFEKKGILTKWENNHLPIPKLGQ